MCIVRSNGLTITMMKVIDVVLAPLFPLHSWAMMMSCWDLHPQQRPLFTDLVIEIFDMLDKDSNYLKLN